MSGFTSLGKKGLGGAGGGGNSLNANATGPFGTALVSGMTPTGQATFVYGINNTQWVSGTTGNAADVLHSEAIMTCSSGQSPSGSASVRLARSNKYRAGQGGLARFTAIFGPGQSDTMQLAGVGNGESGFYFAMSGSNFGILHRENSKREIRSFTITSAPAGAATITVTLEGVARTVSINGGGSTSQTAYQISNADYNQLGGGWSAEAVGSVIYFTSNRPGPRTGTFSVFNGGGSIATGATVQVGVLPTETFVPQGSWNVDPMNGSGPSRFTIDVTKGNVYGVGYQYLGFGNPTFAIEDPETGLLTNCHMIRRANASTSVVVRNPSMTVKWEAVNSGSLASSVSIKGASASIFTEGVIARNVGVGFSKSAVKSSISSTEVPVLTIRVNSVFNGQCNYGEVSPFNITFSNDSGASSGGKMLRVFVYKNASLGGPVNFTAVDSRSMVAFDTAATSFTSEPKTQLLKSAIVAANSSLSISLADDNFFLSTGESLTVTAQRVTSDIDNAAVSLSWFEDQ